MCAAAMVPVEWVLHPTALLVICQLRDLGRCRRVVLHLEERGRVSRGAGGGRVSRGTEGGRVRWGAGGEGGSLGAGGRGGQGGQGGEGGTEAGRGGGQGCREERQEGGKRGLRRGGRQEGCVTTRQPAWKCLRYDDAPQQ